MLKNSIFIILLFSLLLSSCTQKNSISGSEQPSDFQSLDYKSFPLGAKEETPERLSQMKVYSNFSPLALLPASVDLSDKMPPVGNQGSQGSCVGWATAYAFKTFLEGLEENWALNEPSHIFSPAWIYNQINSGQDNGAFVSDALALMQSAGSDTLVHFPYNSSDYTTQPTQASLDRALRFKVSSWSVIAQYDLTSIKQQLASGKAVVYRVGLYDDFYNISPTDPVYDQVGDTYRGGHAMTLVGYDDNMVDSQGHLGAFKFINSWGNTWGTWKDPNDTSKGKGYGWISYRFASYDLAAGFQAFIVEDASNTPDTTPPSITFLNPASGSNVNGILDIQVQVYDNEKVAQVDFYLDGELLGSDNTDSTTSLQTYSQTWDTASAPSGSHIIQVTATDARGNQATAQITVQKQTFTCQEFTATNYTHVAAGRAVKYTKYYSNYAKTVGSDEDLGSYGSTWYSPTTTIAETTPGYYVKGNCPSTPPVDTTAPTVNLTAPAHNSTVNGTITFSATASDAVGVTKVEFYISTGVGSVKACEDTSSPYSCSFDTKTIADGTHTLKARAYDAAGNIGIDQDTTITVLNSNPNPDTEAPLVSISNPAANAPLTGTATLSANATDNVGVVKIEFYLDDSKVCEDSSSPFSCDIDTKLYANGSHSLKAQAFDAAGNSAFSAEVPVTINNSSFSCTPWTSTNYAHVQAGRAVAGGLMNMYALTVGGSQDLGLLGSTYYSATTTVKETSPGYFEKGTCN